MVETTKYIDFLKVTRLFVLELKTNLENSAEDVSTVFKINKLIGQTLTWRLIILQVQEIIQHNNRKLMRIIVKHINTAESTLERVVKEDFMY